jgi:hypothetical protein
MSLVLLQVLMLVLMQRGSIGGEEYPAQLLQLLLTVAPLLGRVQQKAMCVS